MIHGPSAGSYGKGQGCPQLARVISVRPGGTLADCEVHCITDHDVVTKITWKHAQIGLTPRTGQGVGLDATGSLRILATNMNMHAYRVHVIVKVVKDNIIILGYNECCEPDCDKPVQQGECPSKAGKAKAACCKEHYLSAMAQGYNGFQPNLDQSITTLRKVKGSDWDLYSTGSARTDAATAQLAARMTKGLARSHLQPAPEQVLQEAIEILPAEVRDPNLKRKGARGPSRLAEYIGKRSKHKGNYRKRWDQLIVGGYVDSELQRMLRIMSGVMAGTADTRASNWRGYEQHVRTLGTPTQMLPLTCDGVGTWLIRRWWIKDLACSKSTNRSLVSSLVARARELGHDRSARRPGIDDYEALKVKRVIKVLDDLHDGSKKKAFPLLISMIKQIDRVRGHTLADERNYARMTVACTAALRGQDHKGGRLRKRNVSKLRGEGPHAWSLDVMPGKAHNRVMPTMISPIGVRPEEILTYHPGRTFSKYWDAIGMAERPTDAYLFPAIVLGEVVWDKPAHDGEFLDWIKMNLLRAGYVSAIVNRITLHSPRAGAATDMFAAGVPLEVIKKQGRWRSDAVLLYLRLSQLPIGRWLANVLRASANSNNPEAPNTSAVRRQALEIAHRVSSANRNAKANESQAIASYGIPDGTADIESGESD